MRTSSAALTYSIRAGPGGPEVGAFFDLDRTLLAGFSAFSFVLDRLAGGQPALQDLADVGMSAVSFRRGGVGFSGMMAAMARMLRNTPERSLARAGERLFEEQLSALVYEDARLLVEAHRARGHTLVVVSAATSYQARPVARDLGIEDVLCTQLEVKGGRLTGRVLPPACWGEAKVEAAREFSRQRGVDLGKSYFYTDGYEDVPLLEAVGQPRPTNPDRHLERLARSRAWPILKLDRVAPPSSEDRVRTLAASALVPPAALWCAGAALLGSRFRTPLNLCVSAWSEVLTRAVGLELRVGGRGYLRARPAVFVFNFQSSVDPLIVAHVLKRDFAPLVAGTAADSAAFRALARWTGTAVFAEPLSKNDGDARRRALVALRSGLSLVASPEKSRGPSPRLAAFRTGPFRLALEAGVPIVPIAIRNSSEALPMGARVVRTGPVDVEVLKPIPTRDWTRPTLRQHTEEVRSLFVDALREAHPR